MTTKTVLISGLLGLAGVLTAIPVSAQILPINAQLTFQQQDISTYANGIYTYRVLPTRVTSKDLLDFLANAYQTNFPFGSSLVLVDYSYFQVEAPDSSVVLEDVSDFLTYTDAGTNYLFQGKESSASGVQNVTFLFNSTIQFSDPAHNVSFTFSGNAQERYSQSARDQYGYRRYADSLLLNGTGSGVIGGNLILVSGRILSPPVRWIQ